MQTLCKRLQDTGQICGSFFFKRGDQTRGNAKVLFATLAYQLALCQHELKVLVSLNVEIDPSVLGRGMDVQLRTLIVEPCKWLQNDALPVLLIDGLDECEGHDIQREILHLIGVIGSDQCLRLRILIASRPEPHIRESFEKEVVRGRFDSTNIEQSFKDVRTYLCDEFSRIHREHSSMRNIPTPWPSPQMLEMLVRNPRVTLSMRIRLSGSSLMSIFRHASNWILLFKISPLIWNPRLRLSINCTSEFFREFLLATEAFLAKSCLLLSNSRRTFRRGI
jgi:hypothetical protein